MTLIFFPRTLSGKRNIDRIITELGGCGTFQLTIAFFIFWVKITSPTSMIMMAFGNYNPGWTCMDNSTSQDLNETYASTFGQNDTDECRLYDTCNDVQFTSEISTVVSEWHLVCSRAWISSLIISIQMFGVFLGSLLSGYFGDTFGRKRTMYLATLYHVVVNIIAIFSVSWQMFAVMRFFIGIAFPFMSFIADIWILEFVPFKWRNAIFCIPVWSTGCIFFALLAMATKDWRYLHGINAIASSVAFLPFFWMPESVRWLIVKDKMDKANGVIMKVAKLNGTRAQAAETLEEIASRYKNQTQTRNASCLHLLKRGLKYPTFAVGIVFISMAMIYYAISFSVKSLPGNFFINLLMSFASEVPITPVSSILPNYIGRKLSIIIFLITVTLSLFVIMGFDLCAMGQARKTGILVGAITVRTAVGPAWDISETFVGELYPTVIRSTSISYTSWVARIGAILAPYLIPDDPDTYYINYLIMAVCALVCCVLVIFLPETKGKLLKDVWEVTSPE